MTKRTTLIALVLTLIALSACAGMFMHRNVAKPAASEFGPGPRTSAKGLYIATLQQAKDLKPRKLYTLQAVIVDGATGQAVSNATIEIDGGMPEHGHGLPTKPRMSQNLGGGMYEISGLRFNMGGWWELKLTITTPAGTDTVTFNLAL